MHMFTCPLGQTLTVVRVDTIYADPTIHALVSRAVIHIFLTVVSLESWEKERNNILEVQCKCIWSTLHPLPQTPNNSFNPTPQPQIDVPKKVSSKKVQWVSSVYIFSQQFPQRQSQGLTEFRSRGPYSLPCLLVL